MPLKKQDSIQLTTFAQAKAAIDKLKAKGVPVGTLYEISALYGKVDTAADDYEDDGGKYQYVATVWGMEQEIGEIIATMGNGGFGFFFKLAEVAFYNNNPQLAASQAYSAILALNGVTDAVNAALVIGV